MKYLTKLKIRAEFDEMLDLLLTFLKRIAAVILTFFRFVVYAVSSIGVFVFGTFFPLGIYFCFTVIREHFFKGIPLMETTYYGFFMIFFVVPIVFATIREIAS